MNFLCKIGIHRPLYGHSLNFFDKVSGKAVYDAKCPCGKEWITDSVKRWFGYKVE